MKKWISKSSWILLLVVLVSFDQERYFEKDKVVNDQPVPLATAFQKGESVTYLCHYGLIKAGEATLTVTNEDSLIDGHPVYHMVGIGKTLSVFEWFYKVRDRYETYLDTSTLAPRKFVRRVNEGGYIIDRDYHFVPEDSVVNTQRKGTIKTPADVQDMLSSFYYLRALDFTQAKKGDLYRINAFMDYEMWPFYVRFEGKENLEIGMGEFECYKFSPVVQKGRVFRSDEDVEVWVSADENKIPILVKAKIFVGSVKLELTGHQNLKAKLARPIPEESESLWDWF
ncbi:DUF3108 domain-containing protein [bacterium SCSIO 12741]|nr:DUF3108 domain-containing protein [bacterium SCSIO 12741]